MLHVSPSPALTCGSHRTSFWTIRLYVSNTEIDHNDLQVSAIVQIRPFCFPIQLVICAKWSNFTHSSHPLLSSNAISSRTEPIALGNRARVWICLWNYICYFQCYSQRQNGQSLRLFWSAASWPPFVNVEVGDQNTRKPFRCVKQLPGSYMSDDFWMIFREFLIVDTSFFD